jgi:hypothetical protein
LSRVFNLSGFVAPLQNSNQPVQQIKIFVFCVMVKPKAAQERDPHESKRAQKNHLHSQADDGQLEPTQVATGGAQDGMECIALGAI